jgi:hypothetical protein
MPVKYLATPELRQRLYLQGHSFSETAADATENTDVWAMPDIRVTVAVDPDSALSPEYRNRYFVFRLEYADEPLLPCEKRFPLTAAFKMAAERDPPAGDFIAGPVRWLLHRMGRLPRMLLWPNSSSLTYTADGWLPEVFERVPLLRPLHPKACSTGEAAGAIVLNQEDPADAQVLWSVANHVSHTGDDYFVSDQDAAEVYLLHHHDEVVVSIPDPHKRRRLLDELVGLSDVLMDCSGYTAIC